MEPGLALSSLNASSATTGGNLVRGKHSTNNIYNANSYASEAPQHKLKTQIKYKVLRFQLPYLKHHSKSLGGGSTYQECNRKFVVQLSRRNYSGCEPHASNPKNILDIIKKFLVAFSMFCTPLGMAIHALALSSISFLAVEKLSDISTLFFIGVLQVVVCHSIMGVYIAGVNQLCDIEIDKINKPYLPLASGQMSITTGVIVGVSCLTLSLWLGWIIGSWPLFWGLLLFCLVWTAYSIDVPLLRWKRHPVSAALCVFTSWSIIIPFSSFFHIQTYVFKRPVVYPGSLIFVVAFMSFYSISIALCKDIPDIEGDKKYGIHSFAALIGQERVFWICVSLLEMAFGFAFLAGAISPHLWIKIVTGMGQAILASVLWFQAKSTDLRVKASITSFYTLIWKLLCVEFFLIPLVR